MVQFPQQPLLVALGELPLVEPAPLRVMVGEVETETQVLVVLKLWAVVALAGQVEMVIKVLMLPPAVSTALMVAHLMLDQMQVGPVAPAIPQVMAPMVEMEPFFKLLLREGAVAAEVGGETQAQEL